MSKNKNKKNNNKGNVQSSKEKEVKNVNTNVESETKKEESNTKNDKTKVTNQGNKNSNSPKKEEKSEAKKENKNVAENKKEEKKEEKKVVNNKEQNKLIEKKIKKSSNNDTKVIVGIVVAVIIIAFGIFGFYFAKGNLEYCVSYDGGTVSNADYEVYYKTFAAMLQYYGYPESEIPNQIAQKAAIDGIIVKLAKEAGVEISQEDKDAIENVFNDKEQLEEFNNQGIDIERMRKLYYNDYLITAYIDHLVEIADDNEVLEYIKTHLGEDIDMNEYNTSHILFKTTDSQGNALSDEEIAQKKQKAEETLNRVKNGEDFASLAKELSEDSTASNGGEYVCYDDGYTVEEYINAVKTLKDGEVYATIVETSYGYHIIKLNSKVENGRVHDKNERQEFVDERVNNYSEEYHVNVDMEKLNKLIEAITGSPIPEEKDTSSDESTTDTGTDTTDTQEDTATEGEETAN